MQGKEGSPAILEDRSLLHGGHLHRPPLLLCPVLSVCVQLSHGLCTLLGILKVTSWLCHLRLVPLQEEVNVTSQSSTRTRAPTHVVSIMRRIWFVSVQIALQNGGSNAPEFCRVCMGSKSWSLRVNWVSSHLPHRVTRG